MIREEGKSSAKSQVYELYKNWCTENKLISKSERELNSKIKKSFEDSRVKVEGKTTVVLANMALGFTQLLKLLHLLFRKQKRMF